MAGELQPLAQNFQVVDENGFPTLYFIKWAQQRQIDILKIADTAVAPGTYGDATHVGQFTVDQQGRITAAANVAVSGGGGGGGTPTVRASKIQSSSANSYALTWPVGTVAGDIVIIFGGHGFNFIAPAGWLTLDNSQGTNWNGAVFAKTMTAADITAGGVTLTTGGVFNGVIVQVTITTGTLLGQRAPGVFARFASGPGAGGGDAFRHYAAFPPDLILGFTSVRATGNITINATMTTLQAINATNASGGIGSCLGSAMSAGGLGIEVAWTCSAAGSGNYYATIALRG
jgi:hypothetical protein